MCVFNPVKLCSVTYVFSPQLSFISTADEFLWSKVKPINALYFLSFRESDSKQFFLNFRVNLLNVHKLMRNKDIAVDFRIT